MKRIMVSVIAVLSFTCMANTCKTCMGKGCKAKKFTCEYCEGRGTLPPERLGRSAGVTTWTETTYNLTGIKNVSNVHYKKYSEQRCVGCSHSSAKAGVVTRMVTCEDCKGIGIVEPFAVSDLSTMKSACEKKHRDLDKQAMNWKKQNRGRLDDDKHKQTIDQILELIADRSKELTDVRNSMANAISEKDVSAIAKSRDVIFKISSIIDDCSLILRHIELNKKYPYLETAEEYKKNG